MKKHHIEVAKAETVSRMVDYYANKDIKGLINDTIYYEKKRLKKAKQDERYRKDKELIKYVQKKLENSDKTTQIELLKKLSAHYIEEITATFNPRVYNLSTQALPKIISVMLNALSPKKIIKNRFKVPPIENNIILKGKIDKLKKLSKKGTLLVVPTHVSNLDSPLIGWAIYALGLEPLVYGAGLNLFENKLFGFFMSRLGAYSVDRKKKNQLYKDLLKEYAIFSLENNYSNLFFPGGTRSRDGKIESKLKKGLLGTALTAYYNNLKTDKKNKDIFVVPLNLSYQVVLEGNSLITDHLSESGKSRYIIKDDESFKLSKIANFFIKLFSLDSKIILNFGEPMDLFGNSLDDDGNSLSPSGKIIDKKNYFMENGEIVKDEQRDYAYTNMLSDAIAKRYLENNTIMSVHFISFVAFKIFKKINDTTDFYQFIQTGGERNSINLIEFYKEGEIILNKLDKLYQDSKIDLDDIIKEGKIEEILNDALRYFDVFGSTVLFRKGDRIYSENLKVLYYYHNRVEGYDL